MPPFIPWRLRQADYQPFIDSIRATLTRGGGLRVDHVIGLSRLWWIPKDQPATHGGYVRYPLEDLLDIVCLESVRAGAVVVGEDLGTVEGAVRDAMCDRGIAVQRGVLVRVRPAVGVAVRRDGQCEHPRPADGGRHLVRYGSR